ncbi:MAG TPA: hypothetical protein VKV23_01985 [Acidimicrobiales bacterium]|nr:hypothetical protein [Acidimicrobiales bacterium]
MRDLPVAEWPLGLVSRERRYVSGHADCEETTVAEGSELVEHTLTRHAMTAIRRRFGEGGHSLAQAARDLESSRPQPMQAVRHRGAALVVVPTCTANVSPLAADGHEMLSATRRHHARSTRRASSTLLAEGWGTSLPTRSHDLAYRCLGATKA